MALQLNPERHPSRRSVVATGSTLLAGFGLGTVLSGTSSAVAAGTAEATGISSSSGELAAYRPVDVSSTAYAPAPPEFAVDAVVSRGAKGTGWRAEGGDPQWIAVDLQAVCQVTSIRLTFEADASDPVFVPPRSGNWANGTTGREILSSYAVVFVVEVSEDRRAWTSVYRTIAGTGGVVDIQLPAPVKARWVRMTAQKRSGTHPLGLHGFQVYGITKGQRPDATGWTDWDTHHNTPPRLKVGDDGTVAVESGWTLTMDD